VKLFVPDLGMVVDVQAQDAKGLAERVDVLAYETQPAVRVVVAADAGGCWGVEHSVVCKPNQYLTGTRMCTMCKSC